MYEFDFVNSLIVTTMWPIAVAFLLLVVAPLLLTICRAECVSPKTFLGPVLTLSFLV